MSDSGTVTYKRSPKYAWLVAFGMFLGQFVLIMALQNIYIALDTIAEDFGLTAADLGIWASIMGVFYGGMGLLWGALLDKIGARWVSGLAAVLTAASLIAIAAFVYNVTVGCVFMALIGIAFAGCDDGVIPKIGTTWFHPSKRGLAFSIICLGGSLGGVVCGFIAGPVIEALGWRAEFYIMGGLCLVLAVFIILIVRDSPAKIGTVPYGSPEGTPVAAIEKHDKEAAQAERARLRKVLKTPATYKFGFVMIIWYLWFSVYSTYLVAAIIENGFSLTDASFISTGLLIGCTLGMFIWSPLTNRFGRKTMYILVMILEGASSLLVYFTLGTGTVDFALVYAFVFIMGIFVPTAPIMQNSLGEQFKPSIRGTGSGAAATISCIGRFFGPILAASVVFATGESRSYLLFAAGAIFLAAVAAAILIKPTGGKWGDPLADAENEKLKEGELILEESQSIA